MTHILLLLYYYSDSRPDAKRMDGWMEGNGWMDSAVCQIKLIGVG